MFKKLVIVLLMVVYGVSSSGMTLYIHYCCGKFDKINFSGTENKKCPLVFQASTKGCCDNKKVEIKIKSAQEAIYSSSHFSKAPESNQVIIASTATASYTLPYSILFYCCTSPPIKEKHLLYKLNCIYLI